MASILIIIVLASPSSFKELRAAYMVPYPLSSQLEVCTTKRTYQKLVPVVWNSASLGQTESMGHSTNQPSLWTTRKLSRNPNRQGNITPIRISATSESPRSRLPVLLSSFASSLQFLPQSPTTQNSISHKSNIASQLQSFLLEHSYIIANLLRVIAL